MILDSSYYLIKAGAVLYKYHPGGARPFILAEDVQVHTDKLVHNPMVVSRSYIAWMDEDFSLYSYNDFGKGKMMYVEAVI